MTTLAKFFTCALTGFWNSFMVLLIGGIVIEVVVFLAVKL